MLNNYHSITKVFDKNGYRVLGLHGGYSELFSKETKFQELDFEFADEIFKKGGSQLAMSRFKPKKLEDINIDTTVQEKYIRFPTDSRLVKKMLQSV